MRALRSKIVRTLVALVAMMGSLGLGTKTWASDSTNCQVPEESTMNCGNYCCCETTKSNSENVGQEQASDARISKSTVQIVQESLGECQCRIQVPNAPEPKGSYTSTGQTPETGRAVVTECDVLSTVAKSPRIPFLASLTTVTKPRLYLDNARLRI
jgi:hypothetical protein